MSLTTFTGLASPPVSPGGGLQGVAWSRASLELDRLDPVRSILASTPPSVRVLDLTCHISILSEDQLIQVVQHARHCTSLVLREWQNIEVTALRTVFIRLGSNLLSVDLSGSSLSDAQLEILSLQLSAVTTLKLRQCRFITTKSMQPMVKSCHTTLTALDLSQSAKVKSECLHWIAGTLSHKIPTCSSLHLLDVSECKLLGDDGLASLGQGCRALRYVNVSECPKVSDAGVSAMCRGLRSLRVLRLQGCPLVGDKGLAAVGQHCHQLRSLNVSRCGPVTDRGLKALAAGAPRLQALNLAGAKKVTEAGLCALAQACAGLQIMNVTGCEQVTKNGLLALIEGLKYVREAKSFFGFVPKDTALLEKFDDVEYFLEENAAIRVQNALMKSFNRKWGRGYLFRMRMAMCATVIQRAFRRHVKRLMYLVKEEENKRHSAATNIQRLYRGFRVRKYAMAERRRRQEFSKLGNYAVRVQKIYRGFIMRKKGGRVVKAINDMILMRREEVLSGAAVYIQTIGRSYLARNLVAALMEIRQQRRLDLQAAAPPIQRGWLCHKARKVMARLKYEKRKRELLFRSAARRIQMFWFMAKGFQQEMEEKRRLAALEEARKKGAVSIQRVFRGFLVRKGVKQELRIQIIRHKAAMMVQKVFRSCRVMRALDIRMNKIVTDIWDMQDMELEMSAKKAAELRPRLLMSLRVPDHGSDSDDDEEDEQVWEEHWDDAQKCYYYFNPQLNESTYEMPQSSNAFQLSIIGMFVKIFWLAEDQWFPGSLVRYNKSKKKHKVEYEDGDTEWMDLMAEQDRVQILDGDHWIMFSMYEPSDVRARRARYKLQQTREKERAAKAVEDAEWVDIVEDTGIQSGMEDASGVTALSPLSGDGGALLEEIRVARVRMINTRTGEVRLKAKDAKDWELGQDAEGRPCYINQRTKQITYENPKVERASGLTAAELQERKKEVMEEVHFTVYLLNNLLEDYHAAQTEKQTKIVFKKLQETPMIRRLAGALAQHRDLFGQRDTETDEYLRYAQEVLTAVQNLAREKEAFLESMRVTRAKLLNVQKSASTVICSHCGHDVPRTLKYCNVCGVKLVPSGENSRKLGSSTTASITSGSSPDPFLDASSSKTSVPLLDPPPYGQPQE
jgi:hypothetical protein